jgi:hypothetical protein
MSYRPLPPPLQDPGVAHGTKAYHRDRAEQERTAAGSSSCMVKDVHLELAELHDLQADGTPKPGAAPKRRN